MKENENKSDRNSSKSGCEKCLKAAEKFITCENLTGSLKSLEFCLRQKMCVVLTLKNSNFCQIF